jgi:hypothetical protein
MDTGLGRPLELDAAAADALAVVTLFTSGKLQDAHMAGRLVDELMADPGGDGRLARGLSSVCAGLLALLDLYGRVPPESALRELGRVIAQADIAAGRRA